jgi:hypothetical protein
MFLDIVLWVYYENFTEGLILQSAIKIENTKSSLSENS